MSLGAKQAGIQVAFAVEYSRYAAQTYRSNHPATLVFEQDISCLTPESLDPWKKISENLIVFGGPPCQGFSWSNTRTRNLDNPSNWLFKEYLRVVRQLRPSWIVFENVQGIVNTANGAILDQITNELSEDYEINQQVLNAMHHGVPQSRSRFFLVGSRNGIPFRFPQEESIDPLTVDDAIRDLPTLSSGASICRRSYGIVAPSEYGRRLRGREAECCNHLVDCQSLTFG